MLFNPVQFVAFFAVVCGVHFCDASTLALGPDVGGELRVLYGVAAGVWRRSF